MVLVGGVSTIVISRGAGNRTGIPASAIDDPAANTTHLENGTVGQLDRPAEWQSPSPDVASAAIGYLEGPGVATAASVRFLD